MNTLLMLQIEPNTHQPDVQLSLALNGLQVLLSKHIRDSLFVLECNELGYACVLLLLNC